MTSGRVVLAVTFLVVAGLAAWFAVAQWDQANHVATVLAAIAGVASVGVAIWAVLSKPKSTARITVKNSGDAKSKDGSANTGFSGGSRGPTDVAIDVEDSGKASSEGDGDTNTGVKY